MQLSTWWFKTQADFCIKSSVVAVAVGPFFLVEFETICKSVFPLQNTFGCRVNKRDGWTERQGQVAPAEPQQGQRGSARLLSGMLLVVPGRHEGSNTGLARESTGFTPNPRPLGVSPPGRTCVGTPRSQSAR